MKMIRFVCYDKREGQCLNDAYQCFTCNSGALKSCEATHKRNTDAYVMLLINFVSHIVTSCFSSNSDASFNSPNKTSRSVETGDSCELTLPFEYEKVCLV